MFSILVRRPHLAWDTDDIEHWKIDPYTKEHAKESGQFLEESKFVTLFPKYREHYLRDVWPRVTAALGAHGLRCVLNLPQGSMTVSTTAKTFDPFIVVKARDLLRLLARSMPFEDAVRVLDDNVSSDVVRIGHLVRNRERFVRRRQRMLGPAGNTLRAIELLTECRLHVQGNTVSVLGPYKSLKVARRIIVDCMNNIHPIYHVKQLMIKRELAKDPAMANESWDRFLPKLKQRRTPRPKTKATAESTTTAATSNDTSEAAQQTNVDTAPTTETAAAATTTQKHALAAKKKRNRGDYRPLFPPPPEQSKVDLQLESGEYFLNPSERAARDQERQKRKNKKNRINRREERAKAFIAPAER